MSEIDLPDSYAGISTKESSLRDELGDNMGAFSPSHTSSSRFLMSADNIPREELQSLYNDLLESYRMVCAEKSSLVKGAERERVASNQRESDYQQKLIELQQRIRDIKAKADETDQSRQMGDIRRMHTTIQSTIGLIQDKTSNILQDQERDLIRAFKARLADVKEELEEERKNSQVGSVKLLARCKKLSEELEWLRGLSDKLTSENKTLLTENRRIKRQLRTQDGDRAFLIKQLVRMKKENAKLRYSFQHFKKQCQDVSGESKPEGVGLLRDALGAMPQIVNKSTRPVTAVESKRRNHVPVRATTAGIQRKRAVRRSARPNTSGSVFRSTRGGAHSSLNGATQSYFTEDERGRMEARFNELLSKKDRQLATEKRRHRATKTAYTNYLNNRTKLQQLFRACIDDVKKDVATRETKANTTTRQPPVDPRMIPVEHFSPSDRINVMEWFLAQDHVLYFLYDAMFPLNMDRPGHSREDTLKEQFDSGLGMQSLHQAMVTKDSTM